MAVETIEVVIERQVYERDGWRVYQATGPQGSMRLVGQMAEFPQGTRVRCEGAWRRHQKYGEQFAVQRAQIAEPPEDEVLVRYLTSFPRIGPQAARAVLRALGPDVITAIARDPDALLSIEALSDAQVESLKTIATEPGRHTVRLALMRLGLTLAQAERVVEVYRAKATEAVHADPYAVAMRVDGIGYKTADRIARHLGWGARDVRRIEGTIRYILAEAAEREGHTYVPHHLLVQSVARLLREDEEDGVEHHVVEAVLHDGVGKGLWRSASSGWQLRELAEVEEEIVQHLARIAMQTVPVGEPETVLSRVERILGVEYLPEQREAIAVAIKSPALIITGGPGTGKSTTVAGVIQAITETLGRPANVLLCAPTARAADRMRDLTGLPAHTIHHLLHLAPDHAQGKAKPRFGPENPLPGDLLIVDECSMLDLRLALQLLRAVPKGMRVVLVGDINQLPPIGPGRFFADLVESGYWPTVRLRFNRRQADATDLARVAQTILEARRPPHQLPGWLWEETLEPGEAVRWLLAWVDRQAEEGVSWEDWVVLSPGNRGQVGTTALNVAIQQHLHRRRPQAKALHLNGQTFTEGDPVVQTRNNRRKQVWNGERGQILSVDAGRRSLSVAFPKRTVIYQGEDLLDLELGYAMSVHKAQGNEFRHVAVVLFPEHHLMLDRPLLFTAVSRAQESCYLIGPDDAVARALHVSSASHRFSGLSTLLSGGQLAKTELTLLYQS